jgi:hypothetical protein
MVKRQVYGFVVLISLGVFLCNCASSAQSVANLRPVAVQTKDASGALANNAANPRTPLRLPLVNPRIEVRKAERKLLLFANGSLVRTYQVGLGLSPVGDKIRSGDHRNPEGDFYIFIKNPKSAFYLSLGVSYPNLNHARRGLRDGLISQPQYDQIAAAIRQKKTPPQRTRLGGDIFIHGHGASSDWTWGCVALENEDVREFYEAIEVGTPVTIKP